MCGIFGYFDRSGASLEAAALAAMGDRIRHRGPDDRGIFSAPGVALGNQRLSIIDIAGGHQPFVSDDGAIVVVQNGEIFNHVELSAELAGTPYACRTHSDTEVLLRLYERDGIDFIDRLNGMFAIAIYDAREDATYLIRDRVGVKPLYVAENGSRILFASEIKSIFAASDRAADIDGEAISHFLTFNYVPPPYTMYRGIRHLMPGHVMKITRASTSERRWWDLSRIAPENDRSEADWIEEFNAILEDAVRIRMRADVPFGAFLSGGVDSSTVVGLMAKHSASPIKTFCIGFDDPRYDEAPFAQAAADRFGTDHVMERVSPDTLGLWPLATWHCDQPHGDVSFLPTYRVSELASRHVKVVLTGDGGDELFAGYDKYRDFFARSAAADTDDAAFGHSYFESISLYNPLLKQRLLAPDVQAQVNTDPYSIAEPWLASVRHQDRINQALFLDTQLLLSGNNLVKPDRMGMAVSLEARTPFLDYRMVEFAFRMPGALKLHEGETKYIYKKAVTPLIGGELAYRRKQMFTVPVGDWFRTSHREYLRTHLRSLTTQSDMFRPAVVDEMFEAHVEGRANYTRELRALVAIDHAFKIAERGVSEDALGTMAAE